MRRVVLTLSFVVAAVGGLAACGDKAPSKADYMADADPICKRGNDAAALFTTPSDPPAMKEYATKLADNTTRTVDALDKLKQPKGAEGTAVKEFLKAMRDAAGSARAIGPIVDKQSLQELEIASNAYVEAYKTASDKARTAGSTECGVGEAASTTRLKETVGPTLKNAYIAKVDPLCATGRKDILALEQPTDDLESAKAYLTKAIDRGTKLVADIRAVIAPDFDRPKLEEMFSAWDKIIDASKAMREAIVAEDEERIEDISYEIAHLSATFRGKASAYGFHDCGQA